MTPVWAWSRRELRRRPRAAVGLLLLIGLSGAVVLAAAAGAQRTGTAFERFADASNAADAQVQYSSEEARDDDILAALRAHPDVEKAEPLYITVAFNETSDYDLGVFAGPSDELFRTIDVPRVLEGRLPDPSDPHEVVVNRFTQGNLDVDVGDTVEVATFSPNQFRSEVFDAPAGPVIPLEVVGISVTLYDLADPEFSGFYGTPAYHDQYWGRVGGFGPSIQVATRDGADASDIAEDVLAGFEVDELFIMEQSQQTERIRDGERVLAVGLWAFAAVAGVATVVATAQAIHRRLTEAGPDVLALHALGLNRRERTAAIALAVLPVVGAGLLLAMALSMLGSVVTPIGDARQAEPSPGFDVNVGLLAIGGLLLGAVLVVSTAVSAARIARHGAMTPEAPRTRRPLAAVLASGRLSPSTQLGVTMALDPGRGRRAVPVRSALLGAGFGLAGVIAVLTFGRGLERLVDEPAASGWNWTFAPDIAAEDREALREIDGTQEVGVIRYRQVVVDETRQPGVSMEALEGSPSFTVVRGRMPAGTSEVALGPKTADELGVGVGEAVEIEEPDGGSLEMVVVGEVLAPVFDDNAFNEGVALAPSAHDAVSQSDGFESTIVTFEEDVSDHEAAVRVREVFPDALSVYAFPSPPPDVAHLDGVRFLPRVLGFFLGALGLAAVGHALATSVRRRRQEIGIVRALGFVGSDIMRSLSAQSSTLVVAGLIAGLPLGVAAGRVAWRVVAEGIGVPDTSGTPPLALVGVAVATLLAGLLLSVVPGRMAARQRAVEALRVE